MIYCIIIKPLVLSVDIFDNNLGNYIKNSNYFCS